MHCFAFMSILIKIESNNLSIVHYNYILSYFLNYQNIQMNIKCDWDDSSKIQSYKFYLYAQMNRNIYLYKLLYLINQVLLQRIISFDLEQMNENYKILDLYNNNNTATVFFKSIKIADWQKVIIHKIISVDSESLISKLLQYQRQKNQYKLEIKQYYKKQEALFIVLEDAEWIVNQIKNYELLQIYKIFLDLANLFIKSNINLHHNCIFIQGSLIKIYEIGIIKQSALYDCPQIIRPKEVSVWNLGVVFYFCLRRLNIPKEIYSSSESFQKVYKLVISDLESMISNKNQMSEIYFIIKNMLKQSSYERISIKMVLHSLAILIQKLQKSQNLKNIGNPMQPRQIKQIREIKLTKLPKQSLIKRQKNSVSLIQMILPKYTHENKSSLHVNQQMIQSKKKYDNQRIYKKNSGILEYVRNQYRIQNKSFTGNQLKDQYISTSYEKAKAGFMEKLKHSTINYTRSKDNSLIQKFDKQNIGYSEIVPEPLNLKVNTLIHNIQQQQPKKQFKIRPKTPIKIEPLKQQKNSKKVRNLTLNKVIKQSINNINILPQVNKVKDVMQQGNISQLSAKKLKQHLCDKQEQKTTIADSHLMEVKQQSKISQKIIPQLDNKSKIQKQSRYQIKNAKSINYHEQQIDQIVLHSKKGKQLSKPTSLNQQFLQKDLPLPKAIVKKTESQEQPKSKNINAEILMRNQFKQLRGDKLDLNQIIKIYNKILGEVVKHANSNLKSEKQNWIIPCFLIYKCYFQIRLDLMKELEMNKSQKIESIMDNMKKQNQNLKMGLKSMFTSINKIPNFEQIFKNRLKLIHLEYSPNYIRETVPILFQHYKCYETQVVKSRSLLIKKLQFKIYLKYIILLGLCIIVIDSQYINQDYNLLNVVNQLNSKLVQTDEKQIVINEFFQEINFKLQEIMKKYKDC